jgi:hypothetical protein
MSKRSRRGGLCLACLLALAPLLALARAAPGEATPRVETLTGKVVPLADLVARAGGRLDVEDALEAVTPPIQPLSNR